MNNQIQIPDRTQIQLSELTDDQVYEYYGFRPSESVSPYAAHSIEIFWNRRYYYYNAEIIHKSDREVIIRLGSPEEYSLYYRINNDPYEMLELCGITLSSGKCLVFDNNNDVQFSILDDGGVYFTSEIDGQAFSVQTGNRINIYKNGDDQFDSGIVPMLLILSILMFAAYRYFTEEE